MECEEDNNKRPGGSKVMDTIFSDISRYNSRTFSEASPLPNAQRQASRENSNFQTIRSHKESSGFEEEGIPESEEQKTSAMKMVQDENIGEFINLYEKESVINRWKQINYKVWNVRATDPNLFFYYFHKFDEELTVTPFEQIEEESLLHILIQIYSSSKNLDVTLKRVQGKWGFLSLKIPYRNGLSCYQHYLKLKMKRNEFKKDEVFVEYLKEKITDEDLVQKVTEKNFLKFFLNLSPGYKEVDQYSDFWMKEALRNLEDEQAKAKIEQIDSILATVNNDKKYFLITGKQSWKTMSQDAFANILAHPYVVVVKNKVPKLPANALVKESPMRSPGTTKYSSKETSVKKTTTNKDVPENVLLKALMPSDRVNKSTDVSTVVGDRLEPIPSQPNTSVIKENNMTILSRSEQEAPAPKIKKKKSNNNANKKKNPKKIRKLSEEQKRRIQALLSTYRVNVENYDSEPERELSDDENRNLPVFFSEISSVRSAEDEDFDPELISLRGFRELRIADESEEEKEEITTPEKSSPEGDGERSNILAYKKRKFKESTAKDKKVGKKKVKVNTVSKERFEVEAPVVRKKKEQKRRYGKRKDTLKEKRKESRRIRLEKELKLSPKKKLSIKQIPKKRLQKQSDLHQYFIADDIEAVETHDVDMAAFREPEFGSKSNSRLVPSTKKSPKLDIIKAIKKILKTEDIFEEVKDIHYKMAQFEEKKINYINYSVLNEFVEDEDVVLQNLYARLIRFEDTMKKFSKITSLFSIALYEEFDPSLLLLVKKEWEVFLQLEKEFYKFTLFSGIKENTLRESGELGLKCVKYLNSLDNVICALLQQEAIGLKFVLGLAQSEKRASEELVIKEHSELLLKFFKHFIPFLKRFGSYLSKSNRIFNEFLTENIAYYFLSDAYLNSCSQPFNTNFHEEFIATILNGVENKASIWNQVTQGLHAKIKSFIQYLIKIFHDKDPFATFMEDSLGSWSRMMNVFLDDHVMNILKKTNERADSKEVYSYACFATLWLQYILNLEVPFSSIAQNLSCLSDLVSSRPLECYVVSNVKFMFSSLKISQYLGTMPNLKQEFGDKIQEVMIEMIEISKNEIQITKAFEIIIQLSKISPMKATFFFDTYDRLTKLLKGNTTNLQINDFSYEKILSNERLTLNAFVELANEARASDNISKLVAKNQANVFLAPLLLSLLFSQEVEMEQDDEAKQIKLTKRIISKSLSCVPNYMKLSEESVQDPKQFRLFLLDFSVIIATISLTKRCPELLKSIQLKLNNFVGNLNDSHMVIRSLMLNLQIELMNFCIPFPECLTLVGEIHEKIFTILNGLLGEFLEVSKYMNMLSRFDKSTGTELSDLEEKYSKLQKLIEKNMISLRTVTSNHFRFIVENKIHLFRKNSNFLSMLNPKQPITCGLRKQVLEYLELTVPSTTKVNQTLKTKEFSSSSSQTMEQEDEMECMGKMLERAQKYDSFTVELIAWRQTTLENGKEILATIQEMIMSIYNKEILSKVHVKFHIDIFLIEKGLELYATIAKLLLLKGQLTHEHIEQQFGLNSIFSTSKLSRVSMFNTEIITKGIFLSRNQKLALLLRFYTTFLTFEKDQNKVLLQSNNKTTHGIETFLTSAHQVLFLSSIQTVSNMSILQQEFYNAMSDFVLNLYSQEKEFTVPGFKEFLMAAYLERGFADEDIGRDSIIFIKKIVYNIEIFCMENEADEKRLLLKFFENFVITLVRLLRQDLFDEWHNNNNGKFFLNVYKNLCALIVTFSKILSAPTLNRPLTDLLGFIFMDTFNKISFSPVDDFLTFYDPFMIKVILNENLVFETKILINAVFSIPHKDKHFPRKVFVKLLIFLLQTDFTKLEKFVTENNSNRNNAKVKKWEVAFKRESEINMVSENFIQNLVSYCLTTLHTETLLNTFREIVNYTMLENDKKGLIIPFLKALHSTISNQSLIAVAERLIEILLKLSDLVGITEYSYEEKISLLYVFRLCVHQGTALLVREEDYKSIYRVSAKWIVQILSKFDPHLSDKLNGEAIDILPAILGMSQAQKSEHEIDEMEVKIFGVAIKICDQAEQAMNITNRLALILKELVQEKIKIKLSLGDVKVSGEVKKILQILNEF